MTATVPTGNVLGVDIAGVDLNGAVAMVIGAARHRRPLGVSALAVHGVMTARSDPTLRFRLNQLELVLADGQPVRWALRWLHGIRLPDRVFGPDLMWEVCRHAADEGLGVFFFGSRMETLEELQHRLQEAFPSLRIAGAQPSRFRSATEAERTADLATIEESGASIVFVGLGCPRQEIWAYENRLDLSLPVLAVGAAFDFHAGRLKRAPRWMGRAGLEWLYRLYQEPRRLAGRYLRLNPVFLIGLTTQLIGLETRRQVPISRIDQVRPG